MASMAPTLAMSLKEDPLSFKPIKIGKSCYANAIFQLNIFCIKHGRCR